MTTERKVKGLLGTKLGMTELWDANNRVVPVTVVQAGPCVVTQVRTPASDGYSAVQLGFGAVKAKQLTKPSAGHFEKAGEPVSLHDTGGALALDDTGHDDDVAIGENVRAQLLTEAEFADIAGPDLEQMIARRHPRLFKVPGTGLGDLLGLDSAEAELDC